MRNLTINLSTATAFSVARYEGGFESQSDLANDMGVTASCVHNWERGRNLPTFVNGYKLCRCLGLSIEGLAGVFLQTLMDSGWRLREAKKRMDRLSREWAKVA